MVIYLIVNCKKKMNFFLYILYNYNINITLTLQISEYQYMNMKKIFFALFFCFLPYCSASNIGDILVQFSCNKNKTIDGATGAGTCYIVRYDVNNITDATIACHTYVNKSSWVGNIGSMVVNDNLCDMGRKYTDFDGVFIGGQYKDNQDWEWFDGKLINQTICSHYCSLSSSYRMYCARFACGKVFLNDFYTDGIYGFGLYISTGDCKWYKATKTVKSVLCMISEPYTNTFPNGKLIDRLQSNLFLFYVVLILILIIFVCYYEKNITQFSAKNETLNPK